MYKVGVAGKMHKGFGRIEFKELIPELKQLVPSVRAFYHMYLKADDSEIAYAMAIDALFLFELLFNNAGTRLAQDGMLKETMMLENQVPIIVLKNILLIECSEPNSSHVASKKKKKSPIIEKFLPQMLLGYRKALSPLHVLENYPASIALKHPHLLDLLYHLIMLKELPEEETPEEEEEEDMPQSRIMTEVAASKLCDGRVKFSFTNHIIAIGFDRGTTTFKLPNIKIDVNSKYIELTNGIIETTKEVKVLRDHGILKTDSLKDDEVVKIFSGTSKSVQLASTHELYKAIADVNNYYNGLRKVKAHKFLKKCVFTLWNVRTLFAAILPLSLMALQRLCSVYGCSRIFNNNS
ncbi:putative UPF0481 protein At3g02645 [Castanea sativa]|uniref:putative UPF0481 protein At3g02645 n=1 Tax=Castanea sativa TaxID=21020 RepID=UPI003F650061